MTYHIYKILNLVNGKAYIGFTSKAPEKRLAEHCRDALAKRDLKKRPSGRLLYNAIRQYGSEAFVVEVLFSSTDKDKTKNEMESRFIKEENSHYIAGYGYNMTFGGDGSPGYSPTPEERAAARMRMLGHKNPFYNCHHDTETRKRISNGVKQGITSEVKRKMSEAKLGKPGAKKDRKYRPLSQNWEERKKLGICRDCYEPVVPNRVRCQKHLTINNNSSKNRREYNHQYYLANKAKKD